MAKLVPKSNIFKRKKKWESFKLSFRRNTYSINFFLNIYLGLHIYNPKITEELTNTIKDIYLKVAPFMESLINQLPL